MHVISCVMVQCQLKLQRKCCEASIVSCRWNRSHCSARADHGVGAMPVVSVAACMYGWIVRGVVVKYELSWSL